MEDIEGGPLQNIFKVNTLSIIRNYLSLNDKLAASLLNKNTQKYLKEALKVNVHVVERENDKKIENLEQKLEEIHTTKIIESFSIDMFSRKYDFLEKTPSINSLSIFIHQGQENLNYLNNLQNLKKLEIFGQTEGEIAKLITLNITGQNNSIEELILNDCDIKSVDALKSLKKLVLNRSDIKESKKNSNLKVLEYISDQEEIPIILQQNNASQLEKFNNVEEFKLMNIYSKENLHFLQSFQNLQKLNLYFSDEYKAELNFLSNKNGLIELHLYNLQINRGYGGGNDLSRIVGGFRRLQKLSLNNMELENIDFVDSLQSLKELRIQGNPKITNFTNIGQIQGLELLDISCCDIKDINFFPFLISLKKLYMKGNKQIKKFEPMTSLGKLEELDISECDLINIDFFQELQSIKILNLSKNNQIKNFDPLRAINALEKIDISSCGLKSIDPLVDLQNLKDVNLSNNQGLDINPGKFYNSDCMTITK